MRKLGLILGCVLYVLFPIDVVPDFIIGLGQVDDLIAVALTVRSVLRSA